ncbi:VRR-NUC domain-containing protein [Bifidobacterium castoris]|uniref:Nuclease n=1 Tax=Bifidobacterium castoris TaxID=2306972 RepID=A0A430FAN6_9BIFI|nr:VRR-NUC domain-containing protein [Bifidobacterium castoris]RSX49862.1 nuclease [Bifidobacterium castoris]
MRERDVERRLGVLAARRGGWSVKWSAPGTAGVPDRLVFLPDGRLFMVEVKRPGGRVHDVQPAIHRRLARLGWPVHVVDDADRFFHDVVDAAAPADGSGS